MQSLANAVVLPVKVAACPLFHCACQVLSCQQRTVKLRVMRSLAVTDHADSTRQDSGSAGKCAPKRAVSSCRIYVSSRGRWMHPPPNQRLKNTSVAELVGL